MLNAEAVEEAEAAGVQPAKMEPIEEPPLQLPELAKIAPAVIDLPTVERDGKQITVKDVMLDAAADQRSLSTRVDVRNVSLSVIVGKPSKLASCLGKASRPVERHILEDISFSLLPGETTVMLGGPRSGKSSLLDVIAGRITTGVEGEITINGAEPGEAYQRLVSYVVQGDDHAALLTVKETLEFAARCQMPTEDPQLIDRRVDGVLQLLGLKHCKDTVVGDWAHRGVSGGEKRRCTIAIEWVKGPRFFLLDEPTTGLDSGAAMNIGRCLRAISGLGTPVLCALLQPSWELVSMFDKLLMIAEGKVAYWGPVGEALPYFASLGFHPPPNYSASEFLSELVDRPDKFEQEREGAPMRITTSSDFLKAWRESDMRARMLSASPPAAAAAATSAAEPPALKLAAKQQPSMSHFALDEAKQEMEVFARSPLTQFKLLVWRGILLRRRDWKALLQQMIANALVGLLMGLLFFQLDNSQAQSNARFGLIFFLVARLSFESLATLPGLFIERPYVTRQRAAHYYQMLPYAASSLLLEFPFRVVQVFVFTVLVYWISAMNGGAGNFFFALMLLMVQACLMIAFARTVGAITPDPFSASLIGSTLAVIMILYSGFLITRTRMPRPWLWMHYLSPMKYASDALSINEFHGLTLFCTPQEMYPPPSYPLYPLPYPIGYQNSSICPVTTGNQLLELHGISNETWSMWLEFGILLIFFVVFCVTFYLAVRLFKWSPVGRNAGALPAGKRKASSAVVKAKEEANPHAATLSWRNLEYLVPNPAGGDPKTLLHEINGYVKPGMLLALIGPSGAGKTTLLDLLAARKTVGEIKGTVLLDGKPLTKTYPRVVGYVEQFDMHYPLQTVREAFHFAAKSRLPIGITSAQRDEIVGGVIALLEMEALGDRLVAALNPDEQKRLAMGVELVSQPSVLFLDEPTSGLDSNSADRVMRAIEKVARSGTAVVCTIHQPSSRIFFRATHLLLLRRGGQVVYFGELGASCQTLMHYFRRLGLAAPPGMNPADFVLEVALGNFEHFLLPAAARQGADVHDLEKKSKKEKKHKKEKKQKEKADEAGDIPMESIASAVTTPAAAASSSAGPGDLAESWKSSPEGAAVVEELKMREVEGSQAPITKAAGDDLFALSLKREYALHWGSQFFLLMGRWIRALARMPELFIITVGRALLIGFLLGSTFFRIPHDQQGSRELPSVIFFSAIFSFLTAFAYIPAFYIQRAIFYRERAERMYRVSSWGLSRAIMDLPSILLGNFIVGVMVYWIAGLRPDAGAFFWFMLTLLVFGCVALAFAQMLAAAFVSIDVAGLVFSSVFATFALAAGFLIPRPQIRDWMRWLYWISFNRYFLESLAVNELKADTFDCSDVNDGAGYPIPIDLNGTLVTKSYCPITDGNQVLAQVGAYPALQYYDTLILFGYWLGMMLFFLFCLRFFKNQNR